MANCAWCGKEDVKKGYVYTHDEGSQEVVCGDNVVCAKEYENSRGLDGILEEVVEVDNKEIA